MFRLHLQSLSRLALLILGAVIVVDWLATEASTEDEEEKKAPDDTDEGETAGDESKAEAGESAESKRDDSEPGSADDKDVEGEAVVED